MPRELNALHCLLFQKNGASLDNIGNIILTLPLVLIIVQHRILLCSVISCCLGLCGTHYVLSVLYSSNNGGVIVATLFQLYGTVFHLNYIHSSCH